jgi:Protein of unknown function (DUF2911)
MRIHALAAVTLALLARTLPAAATMQADSAAFIIRLGTDTTAVERYVRRGERIDALSVTRSPRTTIRRLTVWLSPDGGVSKYATGGGSGEMREVAVPNGAIPLSGGFYIPWELALMRAAGSGGDEYTVEMLNGSSTLRVAMRRAGAGAWRFSNQFDQPVEAMTDGAGRLRRFAIAGGGASAERVAWVDIDAVSRSFTARDAAGRGMGALSPLDSVTATIAGASMVIEYSRPSLRGRELDVLVPIGQVWRLGANNATSFTTNRPVRFGTTVLPAGAYSLFIDRSRDSWTLIVNRQTGMSGLDRDPGQDIVRVPLSVATRGSSVETLTLHLESGSAGMGVLRMQWGRIDASATFGIGPSQEAPTGASSPTGGRAARTLP